MLLQISSSSIEELMIAKRNITVM